jgi:hypothetical protein
MPDLYVANCSYHEHDFAYRLIENPRPFMQPIGAGKQIKITASQDDIDQIIRQHQPYGFCEVNEVAKGFGGMCYRLGKPISVGAIESGISQKDQDNIDRALEARKINAVATDQQIAKVTQELGGKQLGAYEIEISEDNKGPTETANRFEQTIAVVKEDVAPIKRGRGKKS